MDLDFQIIFNILVGLSGALGGWILNTIWGETKQLRLAESQIKSEVSDIKVLVAGSYVSRDEYRDDISVIRDSLVRIEGKLDGKADK